MEAYRLRVGHHRISIVSDAQATKLRALHDTNDTLKAPGSTTPVCRLERRISEAAFTDGMAPKIGLSALAISCVRTTAPFLILAFVPFH
jgi:hypothetical protein